MPRDEKSARVQIASSAESNHNDQYHSVGQSTIDD